MLRTQTLHACMDAFDGILDSAARSKSLPHSGPKWPSNLILGEGKESRVLEGREMIFEKPLKADYAIVRAWKGDKWGNLVFRKTARNFSPMMCTAARITIAEVENLVEVGEIEPDQVHVPSVYVQRIFKGPNYQKWIEKRTVRKA